MQRTLRGSVLACLLVLLASACTVNVNEGAGGVTAGGGESAVPQDENTGTVNVAGAGTGNDGLAIEKVFAAAGEGQDWKAVYAGSDAFEQNVIIQIEGGTPPDIALFPQPGAVIEQAKQGNAIAMEDLGYDIAEMEARFGKYLVSLGEYEGKHYGFPESINFKSAIWYNPKAFDAAGYEIPTTWEELIALSDQIVADGKAPWCIGTGSDAATGWPATDWMEDIVLRSQGTEVYDQWVKGEVKFSSPEIKSAAERFGEIVFTPGYVFGGPENISGTDFRDAPDPMFQEDPPCYLHRQATFITNFFDAPVDPGSNAEPAPLVPFEDYDFFPFPTIDGQDGVLMAGGLGAVFNNRPEVKEFIDIYTSADIQCLYGSVQEGVSIISSNLEVGPECYDNPLIAQAVDPLNQALNDGIARFDASDLMPPAVGSGSFWTGMNDYTNDGPGNLDKVLADIDASWPSS